MSLRPHSLDAALQAFARQLAAAVLALGAGCGPSVIIFPALVASSQGGSAARSEAMQQVLGGLKAGDGALLQGAQLLLQQLINIACLWSEQWLHTLSDAQVCIAPMPQCACLPPTAGIQSGIQILREIVAPPGHVVRFLAPDLQAQYTSHHRACQECLPH